MTRTV